MEIKDRKTFWDTFDSPYQMGEQKHRLYILEQLIARGVDSLLDVGCGTGPIYEIITNHHMPIIYKGTDYSPAMIEVCQKEFPEGNWQVEDARFLDEVNRSWDTVLLLHALDHLDDYKAAIHEAARVAKRYVVICLWRGFVATGTNLNSVNRMGKQNDEAPWADTHLQEYSTQTLKEVFDHEKLIIEHTAAGDDINSSASGYNFLYILRKYEDN